jgi:predicted RNase H-like HicB family nuclease
MSIKLTVVIQKEEDWYVSRCLENNVASQGKTIEESMANLSEAISLYYEDNEVENISSPVFVTTMEVAI